MSKKAIVFLNMGAPRDLSEVKVFLKNMFNDKNIITVKKNILRKVIATSIVTARGKEATENYKKLGGFSPLVTQTKKLLEAVQKEFPDHIVINIMRYTPPFAQNELRWLKAKKVEEIILFPLYPHYSTTTVKSSLEDFYEACEVINYQPTIKEIAPFYTNPHYNKAVIETIKAKLCLQQDELSTIDIIFSAHSLPKKIVCNGDCYQEQVERHVKLLTRGLKNSGLRFRGYHLAYQSKLGPVAWLEPALGDKLKELKEAGSDKVLIVPLSFVLDNSETEFELDIEYRMEAKELLFEEYRVAKCPNASPSLISAIKELVTQ
jgi:ferrochelatase